jgi:hypothetical protein
MLLPLLGWVVANLVHEKLFGSITVIGPQVALTEGPVFKSLMDDAAAPCAPLKLT